MRQGRSFALAMAVAAASAAVAATPAGSQTTLRAVSAQPRTVDPTRSFLDHLIHPSNRANRGGVRPGDRGGPGGGMELGHEALAVLVA